MAFVGRQNELKKFNERYNSANAEFIFLYGRRRVGKTEFLNRFSDGKETFFFSATESTDNEQKRAFKDKMLSFGFDGEHALLNDWENIFKNLGKLRFNGRKALILIDEFQYIFKGNRSVASILQNVWDHHLSKNNIMIVLCGSAMSFIEKKVLGSKNPLYGRATAIFKMTELSFEEAAQFFPNYTLDEKIITYAILGGTPYYLKQFSPSLSIEDNIKENILSRDTILYNEIEFLLRKELRETATYNTIISAIAMGSTKINEISQKTMIESSKINVYLKNLIELNIVAKEQSALDPIKKSGNIQNGLYKICDNFFIFWYSFVYPNIGIIETGHVDALAREITEGASTYHTSLFFEELCIRYVKIQNALRKLPFKAAGVGRAWSKRFEIDVAATDGRTLLAGECKWTDSPVGTDVLNGLREKIAENKELASYAEHIIYLFSRSGFTKSVEEEAKKGGVVLVSANDLFVE